MDRDLTWICWLLVFTLLLFVGQEALEWMRTKRGRYLLNVAWVAITMAAEAPCRRLLRWWRGRREGRCWRWVSEIYLLWTMMTGRGD